MVKVEEQKQKTNTERGNMKAKTKAYTQAIESAVNFGFSIYKEFAGVKTFMIDRDCNQITIKSTGASRVGWIKDDRG